MKSGSWQGKEIRGMIRTLTVHCTPILDCFQDAGKTAAETAFDEMVMGAVRALCEFSHLVSQQNHSDVSLAALDDALKRFYKMHGAFRDEKMSKSAKAKVNELLAAGSNPLREQKIRKVRAAMEDQLYGAEKVTTSKRRQFQVGLNRAWHRATIWSDADWQRAIERLEREIHLVTPATHKHVDKLFQHHEQQLLKEFGTKATGPRSIFPKKLAQMNTAAEKEAYGVVNITADKHVQFQVCQSDAQIEATTCNISDTDRVVKGLEREIHGITSKHQMLSTKEFSIRWAEFEAWWQEMGIQELRKTIKQLVIHFRYPKMHLVSHISGSNRRIGSGDNITTNISERLHIGNVKEACRSTNRVNYIQQMLTHNDRCTGLAYMEETLSYLALQGWYDNDSAKIFILQLAADEHWNTSWAHPYHLWNCPKEPFLRPVSPQVHHLRETHVRGVCRSFKLTSLKNASIDCGIPNVGQLFRTQIEDDWGHAVSGLVLGYDQNVLIESVCIKLQNGLLYYRQPFHCPTSVERLGLDCKVEYTDANHGIMPESYIIRAQYTGSDLENTFQGRVPSFLYYTSARLHRIRSSNFRSAWPPDNRYPPSQRGARRRSNGYYVLNLKIMRWSFQHSTMIRMVGLTVFMGSSGLSNWLTRCILYLSEQLLDLHISCTRIMLHQIESTAYDL